MKQVSDLFIIIETTLCLYGFKQSEWYIIMFLAGITLFEMMYQGSYFFLSVGITFILFFYRPTLQKENMFAWIKKLFNYYIWEQQTYER